ncbi:hypothetical protein [Aerophototrophica crusticola]|uniref:hypothetical protein n=1 Tax=Aerophototrophica crusticola TaxID=1709002 RepID=UPI00384A6928
MDRDRLVPVLRQYFRQQGITVNWDAVTGAEDERLITSLAMICPFDPPEKQALLEAPCLKDRADLLQTLIEMAVHDVPGGETARH